MFCVKCGNDIGNNAGFCPVCGTNNAQQANNGQFNGGAQVNYNQQPNNGQYSGAQVNYNQQPNNGQYSGAQVNYNQQPNNGQFNGSYANYNQQPNNSQYNGNYVNYNQQPNNGQYNTQFVNQNQLGMGWYKFLIYFALFAGAVLNIVYAVIYFTGSQYGGEYQTRIMYAFYDGLQGLDIFMGILALGAAVLGVITRFSLSGYKKNAPKLVTAFYSYSIAVNTIYLIALASILGDAFERLDVTSFATQMAMSIVMLCLNITYFKKRAHLFVN